MRNSSIPLLPSSIIDASSTMDATAQSPLFSWKPYSQELLFLLIYLFIYLFSLFIIIPFGFSFDSGTPLFFYFDSPSQKITPIVYKEQADYW